MQTFFLLPTLFLRPTKTIFAHLLKQVLIDDRIKNSLLFLE